MKRNPKSQFGFTLTEVVLTVALAGIMAIAAEPLVNFGGAGLDAASKKVRADIHYAQHKAMITGTPHGLLFANGSYVIYESTPATPIADPATLQPFNETLSRFGNIQLPAALQIEFDGLGQATLGGGSVINLTDGYASKGLQIVAATGTVVEL